MELVYDHNDSDKTYVRSLSSNLCIWDVDGKKFVYITPMMNLQPYPSELDSY